jgi:hypothetical protein
VAAGQCQDRGNTVRSLSLAENRSFVVNQKRVHKNNHNRKDDGNAEQHTAG